MSDEGATFSGRPLGHGRGRSNAAVGIWLLGLTAIIGFAVLGRTPMSARAQAPAALGSRSPGVPSGLASGPLADSESPATVPPLEAVTFDVVEFRTLDVDPVTLTTPVVSIEGVVHMRAAEIDVALEDADQRLLDYRAVDVSDPNGGVRPLQSPVFAADLNVQRSAPGMLWIVVSAVRWDGTPLGSVRRAIFVGGWVQVQRDHVFAPGAQSKDLLVDRR